MYSKIAIATIFLVFLMLNTKVFAAQGSSDFTIAQLNTQWSSDIVHVQPVGPHTIINPNACPYNGQYALDSAAPGHKERLSLALGAFLTDKNIQVVVEGCSSDGRPKIISIVVKR